MQEDKFELVKVIPFSCWYTQSGEVQSSMLKLEILYNNKPIILTYWVNDNGERLDIQCYYKYSYRGLSKKIKWTLIQKYKFTILRQLSIDLTRRDIEDLAQQMRANLF